MTEEKKPEKMIIDESLQEAVEKAMEMKPPVEEAKPERKPYLFEQVAWDFRKGLKGNKFRTGRNDVEYAVKLDAEGKEVKHGNGGVVKVRK